MAQMKFIRSEMGKISLCLTRYTSPEHYRTFLAILVKNYHPRIRTVYRVAKY